MNQYPNDLFKCIYHLISDQSGLLSEYCAPSSWELWNGLWKLTVWGHSEFSEVDPVWEVSSFLSEFSLVFLPCFSILLIWQRTYSSCNSMKKKTHLETNSSYNKRLNTDSGWELTKLFYNYIYLYFNLISEQIFFFWWTNFQTNNTETTRYIILFNIKDFIMMLLPCK